MTQHDQTKPQESLNIVIVGHVDHGKSTLVGRLYADTGSLPEGKVEKVQAICRQQGKEFEYAFLFDAFLEEQEQGITIDTARTFFIWNGRQYIIIDAPGHKEFLKNMISGAARAEAALLLIDALEGVREQSKKHGYLLSLLGVTQFAVVVNKMDLVGYRQDVFDGIEGLLGGAWHDTLLGDGQANLLIGGAGNDLLDGRAGDDTATGGEAGAYEPV